MAYTDLTVVVRSRTGVNEDGRPIGRIRLGHVGVNIPGAPYGDAQTLDKAETRFKSAWIAFRDRQDPAKLAQVYAAMNHANRPDMYRR